MSADQVDYHERGSHWATIVSTVVGIILGVLTLVVLFRQTTILETQTCIALGQELAVNSASQVDQLGSTARLDRLIPKCSATSTAANPDNWDQTNAQTTALEVIADELKDGPWGEEDKIGRACNTGDVAQARQLTKDPSMRGGPAAALAEACRLVQAARTACVEASSDTAKALARAQRRYKEKCLDSK